MAQPPEPSGPWNERRVVPALRPARPAPQPLLNGAAAPRGPDGDVPAQRLIPPSIRRFLNDPRIEPATRAFLLGIAGKRQEDWTVRDLQEVSAVVPALTEMHIGTAVLSEFYEFMNLDPTSLFDPQLGSNWQATSTAFDPRNARNRRCALIRVQARQNPDAVLVNDLLNCGEG